MTKLAIIGRTTVSEKVVPLAIVKGIKNLKFGFLKADLPRSLKDEDKAQALADKTPIFTRIEVAKLGNKYDTSRIIGFVEFDSKEEFSPTRMAGLIQSSVLNKIPGGYGMATTVTDQDIDEGLAKYDLEAEGVEKSSLTEALEDAEVKAAAVEAEAKAKAEAEAKVAVEVAEVKEGEEVAEVAATPESEVEETPAEEAAVETKEEETK